MVQLPVSKSMYRCKKLYEIICFAHPEYGLPHLEFPELATTNHQMEQAKALPDSVRVKLVYCLLTLAKQGNPLAFAAAVMFYFGLRTAEAAAVLIGDFKICGNSDYVTYHVLSQIRSDGTADIVLKTDSAYRTTIATHEMIVFIELRINQLKEKGMSESDMQKVPFASLDNQPGAFVSTIKLSEFILNLLLDCGCSKDYISYARELQSAYYVIIEYNTEGSQVFREETDGKTLIQTNAPGWGNVSNLRIKILLKADEEVDLSALFGISGTIEARSVSADCKVKKLRMPETMIK